MRVLQLTWEFPPKVIGGIASHVFDLSRALRRRGLDVHLITCNFPGALEREDMDGVYVYRSESYASADSFLGWILRMQKNMEKKACDVINAIGGVDIIHAHDWLSGVAGIGVKHLIRKPLVVTMHSTEYGRRTGLHNDFQRSIHEIEGWVCYEAWRIITCSYYMRDHVSWCFRLPWDKIEVIPNGVDVTKFEFPMNYWEIRNRFALGHEKLLLFVGRMVPEKGLDTLIKTLKVLIQRGLPAKVVAVGDGPQIEDYKVLANNMGISDKVYFAGHIDDWTLRALYRLSDVAVFPSRFEPFGIVALEAMAAHCPVVASAVGGLKEVVDHGATGLKVPPNDDEALAWAIERIITDYGFKIWLVENAYKKCLWNYNWDTISERISGIYDRVVHEYGSSPWKP